MVKVANRVARTTLPRRSYLDERLFLEEMDHVFRPAWTLVGHVSELERPGAFLTTVVGTEPVIVLRDHEGVLRAMSNVCRHRASLLLEGSGVCGKAIRCPYHGWTYRLDGRLAAAPHGRGFASLDRDAICLPAYRVAELAGLVFACTDPSTPPIDDVFGDVAPFFASLHLERREVFRFRSGPHWTRALSDRWGSSSHRYEEDFRANWKVLVDNYQEDYHVPVSHPSLVRLLDIKETDGFDGRRAEYSWVPLRSRPSSRLIERVYQRVVRPMPGMPEQFERCWGNAFLWPATFFEIYPHHVDTWQLVPLAHGRTRAVTMTLVDPGAHLRDRLARLLAHRIQGEVMDEDTAIVDRVQLGLRSASYERGILNDLMESSVIRFQDMLREAIPEEDAE